MSRIMVRYKVKPDLAETNAEDWTVAIAERS
jgi:translation elongation factor EF-1beta